MQEKKALQKKLRSKGTLRGKTEKKVLDLTLSRMI